MELLRVVLLLSAQHFYGHLRTEGLHDFPNEVGGSDFEILDIIRCNTIQYVVRGT